jgi:hypothetical protein
MDISENIYFPFTCHKSMVHLPSVMPLSAFQWTVSLNFSAGLKVCILGKACLAPIHPILVAQVTILGANIYFGDEQINIFRSTVLLENIF